jgi:hypothetical protein
MMKATLLLAATHATHIAAILLSRQLVVHTRDQAKAHLQRKLEHVG